MHRELSLLTSLALASVTLGACGGETSIREQLPPNPDGEPAPLESSQHTDVIVQTVTPTVDILYMIDNSCSMGDDQEFLSDNAPVFMRWFVGSGLDYHIGVVSSDMVDPAHKGRLQGSQRGSLWIEAEDNNQIPRFAQMAVLGNRGASPEKGIDGIYASKETHGDEYNAGFFRDTSALHTIAVSDEDDFSSTISMGEFIQWYDGLKRSADERSFSAIENANAGASGRGQKYSTVTRSIGGVVWNIRDGDWSPALDLLGLQTTGRKTEYFLSRAPVEATIEVELHERLGEDSFNVIDKPRASYDDDGQYIEGDWYYTPGRNSISFIDFVPPDLAQVHITYTLASAVQDGLPRDGQDEAGDESEASE